MNSGSDEQKICKDLVDKYPNLKDYKTGKRFKVQKKNVEEILKIITDDSDKEKFNEFLSMYNSRKGKTNIIEKKPLEKVKKNTVAEKVKNIEKKSDSINTLNTNNSNNSDNSDNSDNSENTNNTTDDNDNTINNTTSIPLFLYSSIDQYTGIIS